MQRENHVLGNTMKKKIATIVMEALSLGWTHQQPIQSVLSRRQTKHGRIGPVDTLRCTHTCQNAWLVVQKALESAMHSRFAATAPVQWNKNDWEISRTAPRTLHIFKHHFSTCIALYNTSQPWLAGCSRSSVLHSFFPKLSAPVFAIRSLFLPEWLPTSHLQRSKVPSSGS